MERHQRPRKQGFVQVVRVVQVPQEVPYARGHHLPGEAGRTEGQSTVDTTDTTTTLPFGRHANKPLPEVPADYLAWLLAGQAKASNWLRRVIGEELRRRGLEAPPEGPPPPEPACPRCGTDRRLSYSWHEDTLG